MSPFTFLGVASFFVGGLFDEPPLRFLGLPIFSSEVFLMNAFAFLGVASFFVRGLFDEPMNEVFDDTPLFMAPRVCAKELVECQANLSYFDHALK
jgi:hypothetical protein